MTSSGLLTLVNGRSMPSIGLGTWQMHGAECRNAVTHALEMGYRHIDTAEMYANEAEVGEGMAAAKSVKREDIFLTTKVLPSHFEPKALKKAADESLRKLGTEYVDLLLLHWPGSVPLNKTIEALNEVAAQGKARAIGVSNFSVKLVNEAAGYSAMPLATNQVRYHAGMSIKSVLADALARNMVLTAYSPLGEGGLLRNAQLKTIAAKYGRSPAQVALRWLLDQPGVAVIPKASSVQHMRDNFSLDDFALEPQDSATLAALRV